MPDPEADCVAVSNEGGVITATIAVAMIEEREATTILENVKSAMNQAGEGLRWVVLDFGAVSFINSSGLAACIEIRNEATQHGVSTILYRPTEDVNELFKMVKVDRLYRFVNTADELSEVIS